MRDWNEDIFDNFIRLKRGYDLPNKNIVPGKYPIIASTAIKDYHNAYKVKPQGVVTGRSGSLGTVQYISENFWPLNTTLYVRNYKGNFPRYVYYLLMTMHLENFNSGAGVPTLNQNHLHKLKIKIPPIKIQKKTAAILSAYDDLIENNKRRIALLEKMAEEIYREWFVRMRFPRFESANFFKGLPSDWESTKVKLIVDRQPFGRIYRESELYEDGMVAVIDQSRSEHLGFYDGDPQHKASPEKPIILFGDHSCKMVLMTKPFSLAENVIPFLPKNKIQPYFLYHLIKDLAKTTEYKRHWTDLANREVLIPYDYLQKKFVKIVKVSHKKIEVLKDSIRKASKTRDLLLGRLISGKISVEALDIQFPPSIQDDQDVAYA